MSESYPELINVEIMTVCNLRCTHCKVQYAAPSPTARMPMKTFERFSRRLEGLLAHAHEFMFSSVEPLAHPRLFDMMDLLCAINPRLRFPIQTNGMLLTDRALERMAARNVPWISVALDGCDQEHAEWFKKGVDLGRVVRNIGRVKQSPGRAIRLKVVFCAHAHNVASLPRTVDLCAGLGVDEVDVNGLFAFTEDQDRQALHAQEDKRKAQEAFRAASERARSHGIEIRFPSLEPRPIGCESTSIFSVSELGEVAPCVLLAKDLPFHFLGRHATGRATSFGNILSKDPLEIWLSPDFAAFRRKLLSLTLPAECQLCADGYGVICSKRQVGFSEVT